jgi:hypothetical protein
LANNSKNYEECVRAALNESGFYVIEFKDVSTVRKYRAHNRISKDIDELVAFLSPDEPIQFDIFDAYREYDA